MRRSLVSLTGALLLVGCGESSITSGSQAEQESDEVPSCANVREALSSASLSDWTSYADAVLAITITNERAMPVDEGGPGAGDEFVPREVTVQVDQVVWSHPSAVPIPESYTDSSMLGWLLDENGEEQAISWDGLRVEVGGRYLMAVARFEPNVLTRLGCHATLPLDGDQVVDRSVGSAEASDRMAVEAVLAGRSLDEVAAQLAVTPPDPDAEANRHLPPIERFNVAGDPG